MIYTIEVLKLILYCRIYLRECIYLWDKSEILTLYYYTRISYSKHLLLSKNDNLNIDFGLLSYQEFLL